MYHLPPLPLNYTLNPFFYYIDLTATPPPSAAVRTRLIVLSAIAAYFLLVAGTLICLVTLDTKRRGRRLFLFQLLTRGATRMVVTNHRLAGPLFSSACVVVLLGTHYV